jgi:glycosyltransferase involved in cell wall biosynthesis
VQSFSANLAQGFAGAGYKVHVLVEDSGERQGSGPALSAGVEGSVFSYSAFDNLYSVLKRMTELIVAGGFGFVYPNTSAVSYRAIGLLGPRRPVAIGGCTGNNAHDYACNTEFADYLDHIFSVSQQGAEALAKRLAGRGPGISVIPHGVKPAQTSPARSFTGRLRLAFAGRFDAAKRLEDVIKVARGLSERAVPFALTLAGDGPERQRLEASCTKFGLQENVRFSGLVSCEEVDALMQQAHINLLLSESEGFGLSVLEGMKWGCVPIVTDVCGCKDAIRDGANGFIAALGDTATIVERVLRLDRDRILLARLSIAAERAVREEYNSEKELARHLEAMQLAQEHHRQTAAGTVPWKYRSHGLLNRRWVPNWAARKLRRLRYGGAPSRKGEGTL